MATETPGRTVEPAIRTIEEARRALPLLRAIADDAHTTYVRLRARLRRLRGALPLERVHDDAGLPDEVRTDLRDLNDQMRELAELGARVVDPELGILYVDATVDGHPAHLCWKLGEDDIRYFVPLDGGYEDRRPLP